MPVDYVVTGCREELDDMREKLLESERHECEDSFAGVMDYEGDPVYIVNKAHFFGMFGVNEGVEELGDFYIANSECDAFPPRGNRGWHPVFQVDIWPLGM